MKPSRRRDIGSLAIGIIALTVGTIVAAGQGTELTVKAQRTARTELRRSRQLVVVTAQDWSSNSAQVRLFERGPGSEARVEAFPVGRAVLGSNGLAWGIGIHGNGEAVGPQKREGDRRAPAGVFTLMEGFGFLPPKDAKITRIDYRMLTADTEAIDDPRSSHYNRIVGARSIADKDWKTSERMRQIEPYRWGVVVGHNVQQVPDAGSCIFLHVWEGPDVGTAGCTATSEAQMLSLLRWLDRNKNPLLVQLPIREYRRLRSGWKLP